MPVVYGADYEFSTNPQKRDDVFHSHPITSAEDAGKLGVLDATNDTLAAEVAVDGRIVDTYKGEKPYSRRYSTRYHGYRSCPRR